MIFRFYVLDWFDPGDEQSAERELPLFREQAMQSDRYLWAHQHCPRMRLKVQNDSGLLQAILFTPSEREAWAFYGQFGTRWLPETWGEG